MVMNSLHQWCPVSSVAKSSQTKAIRREGAIILRLKLQKDTDAFRLEREKEATKRLFDFADKYRVLTRFLSIYSIATQVTRNILWWEERFKSDIESFMCSMM
ncbi:hypothetical protein HKD37_18G051806 [Glycine soja]|uniref:Uncharacterized protein n=1 Tax=Glycine soja TaxID=3848 RepID=A0A445FXG2_GLYSO|nr:hypothetical protein GmHk_18G052977 [Glycine max]RZB53591.1 hypothetical protein D0Y65_049499 [Glycine soja]